MDVWTKVLRFLLVWLCIGVILVIAAVVVYRDALAAAISGSITQTIGSVATLAFTIAIVFVLLRGLFR